MEYVSEIDDAVLDRAREKLRIEIHGIIHHTKGSTWYFGGIHRHACPTNVWY
jgi:hypothetical protein